jgi:hypothetical protein
MTPSAKLVVLLAAAAAALATHDAHATTCSPLAASCDSAVWGASLANTSYGVLGSSTSAIGVYGVTDGGNWSAAGPYGVYGSNSRGDAVHGEYVGTGDAAGVTGIADTNGTGVYGQTSDPAATQYGVGGDNLGGGYGVYGKSASSDGVHGEASGGAASGVAGINSAGGNGVYGRSSGYGVQGYGLTTNGTGVYGTVASGGTGVQGYTTNGTGVLGEDTASGTGVYGSSITGIAIQGYTTGTVGVWGQSTGAGATDYGVYGTSVGAAGVYGYSNTRDGVHGLTTAAAYNGVQGENTGGGYGGYFDTTGTYSAFFNKLIWVAGGPVGPSDVRLKKNIKPLIGALDKLLRLKGVNFEWKEPEKDGHPTGEQIGFIAQDVEKVFPGWVHESNDGIKGLSLVQIEGLEVESIRTLKVENDALKARLDRLENGSHPIVAATAFSGGGWAFGGLALVGSLIISRRKRS